MNKEWVEAHKHKMDAADVEKTKAYICQHHPWKGRPTKKLPHFHGRESVEFLATFANALIIQCIDQMCKQMPESVSRELDAALETESPHFVNALFANVAYISLNASDPTVRMIFQEFTERVALFLELQHASMGASCRIDSDLPG